MRAVPPRADTALVAAQYASAPWIEIIPHLRPSFAAATSDLVDSVLQAAAQFAEDILVPLNDRLDHDGARLVDGRVRTGPGHADAWAKFIEGGWPTLDHAEQYGGQQLPLALGLSVQELFDRACPAFGMLAITQRAAARLISAWGDETTRQQWLPGLASGDVGATICVSESGAGSDLAQMRTRAEQDADGCWRITGEKCWISFGDHDCTDRIIHCVLALSGSGAAQKPEISLFLVEGGATQGDAVSTLRVEEKLGLHGSPTCVLAFDGAQATLMGERGRGLAQMFVMISQMRLAVGAMGLGIASNATDTAILYAKERRQGGTPGAPTPIIQHTDICRQLTEMISRTELLRGLLLATANRADIAQHAQDAGERAQASALVDFLLPIVKTLGADAAFLNANSALQILGGAGYTREWQPEQCLRDARVLAVFEGATGIQALDLVHRRVRGSAHGLSQLVAEARSLGNAGLNTCLDRLENAAERIRSESAAMRDVEAGAVAFLKLATLAATGWIAARFAALGDAAPLRMLIAARYWLSDIAARAAAIDAELTRGAHGLASADELLALSSDY